MILIKITIYFFLFFLSFKVNSENLTKELNSFFEKQYPYKKDDINIITRTPLNNIYCKKPFFSILNNVNYLGLIDVLLTCTKQHYYLKVEIQVKGEYIVANRKIPRGTKIQESDLKILIGRVDILPSTIYRKKKDVINRINLRDIFPLQAITSLMTRRLWLVQVNQQVTIIVKGNNFSLSSKAKSLSNGAKNDKVRVKIKTGKIITGIVNENGEVIVSI